MTAFRSKRGTVGWPGPQAKAICKAAELLGIDLDPQRAQTGTIYLIGSISDEEVKIRVADHGECYCTETISCDPAGYTVRDAIEWLAAKVGQPVPVAISRGWQAAETRKVNAAKKQADRTIARLARVREILDGVDAVTLDTPEGSPTGWLPGGTENRKARTKVADAAISAAWTQVNQEGI
jgi:hypothetical protein